MAAIITAVRNNGNIPIRTRRQSTLGDDTLELAIRQPPESRRKFDLEVDTLLNGEWQKRRIVCTKDDFHISLVREEFVRDHVPLLEIEAIENMQGKEDIDAAQLKLQEGHAKLETVKRSASNKNMFSDTKQDKDKAQSDFLFVNHFQIRTIPDGYNSGRIYYFRTDSKETCDKVIEEVKKLVRAARKRAGHISRFRKYQKYVRRVYESTPFQSITSALIILNFALSIATAEMAVGHVWSSQQEAFLSFLDNVDVLFITAFTVELAMNLFANWMMPFFTNGWSLFDLIIVSLSLIGLAPVGVPLSLMLLLRSCRVIRIFGKLKAVAKIFAALTLSVLPMINVFFIIFVVASIYSITGVAFFYDDAPEQFSTFFRAFVAMFRITVGSVDWWFDYFPAVEDNGTINWTTSIFLISYVILVTWVFFQVSIAVLLDNFLSASNGIKHEEALARIREKQLSKQFKNPLDPLLLRLAKDFINESDLTTRLRELFEVLDTDNSEDLSSMEFQAAIKKLDFTPRIFVSDSDFIAITQNGTLLNANGRLGPAEFELVMRNQIRMYIQSRLSSTSELWATSDQDFTSIGTIKQILVEQLRLKADHDASRRDTDEILALVRRLSGSCSCGGGCGGGGGRGKVQFDTTAKSRTLQFETSVRDSDEAHFADSEPGTYTHESAVLAAHDLANQAGKVMMPADHVNLNMKAGPGVLVHGGGRSQNAEYSDADQGAGSVADPVRTTSKSSRHGRAGASARRQAQRSGACTVEDTTVVAAEDLCAADACSELLDDSKATAAAAPSARRVKALAPENRHPARLLPSIFPGHTPGESRKSASQVQLLRRSESPNNSDDGLDEVSAWAQQALRPMADGVGTFATFQSGDDRSEADFSASPCRGSTGTPHGRTPRSSALAEVVRLPPPEGETHDPQNLSSLLRSASPPTRPTTTKSPAPDASALVSNGAAMTTAPRSLFGSETGRTKTAAMQTEFPGGPTVPPGTPRATNFIRAVRATKVMDGEMPVFKFKSELCIAPRPLAALSSHGSRLSRGGASGDSLARVHSSTPSDPSAATAAATLLRKNPLLFVADLAREDDPGLRADSIAGAAALRAGLDSEAVTDGRKSPGERETRSARPPRSGRAQQLQSGPRAAGSGRPIRLKSSTQSFSESFTTVQSSVPTNAAQRNGVRAGLMRGPYSASSNF